MEKKTHEETIAALSKELKRRKYFSILLALFTLGVNIFAWFAFSANAGLSLEATVASWDVDFKENDIAFRNIHIEVEKMKPGMTDHVTTVEIENRGDVEADFTYDLKSFTLLGHTINLANKADVYDYLENFYPFSITFEADSDTIAALGTDTFETTVSWPYEAGVGDKLYYALDEVYSYNSDFTYYTKSGNNYNAATTVNASNFSSLVSGGLYLEKDDADTFFGVQCAAYESTSGQPCLTLTMQLLVTQSTDN